MSKGLEALEQLSKLVFVHGGVEQYRLIEKELKQAEENEKLLNVFRNALTIERQMPPELEIKESEKGSSYVFKEAVKIHENRIDEMVKKSLREWVLKNAFPKELKALEIIIKKEVDIKIFKRFCLMCDYDFYLKHNQHIMFGMSNELLTEEEIESIREMLL